MTIITRWFRTLTTGIIVLASCSTTWAGYYAETATISQTATDFSVPLSLQSFNSSLGTLTGVVISYTDNGTIAGTVKNTSPTPQSFTVTENSKAALTFGSSTLLTNNLIAQQSYTSIGAGKTAAFGTDTPSGSAGTPMITSGPLFTAFLEPASSVMLTFATLTSTTVVGGGGNIQTTIHTDLGATVTVTFNYVVTGVPEPASLAMTTIGGLIVIGTTQFRKRRVR